MLLEDAIDVHDRHWKIHWMLNFAQFSATLALNATIADVRGEVDPALPGRLQSLRRGSQLGLDRGAVAAEGAGQGRRRAARRPSTGDTAADVRRRLESTERGPALPGERLEPYRQRVRPQGDLVARVRLPDVVRAARADPRGPPRLPRDRLRLPGGDPGGARRPRRGRAELDRPVDGRGRERLQGGARPVAAHEPADARPPLLHRPGHERAAAARARGHRPRAGARRALDDPEDVLFLRYQELRPLLAAPRGAGARARLRAPRRSRGRLRHAPAEWLGTATQAALDFPYLTLWGFPDKFFREPPDDADRAARARRLAGDRRGHRARRRVAGRVRPGAERATSWSAR